MICEEEFINPNRVAPVVLDVLAFTVKNTLSYDSDEVTTETKSCALTKRLFVCELKRIAPDGELVGMTRVKRALFKEAVERYPADPRPVIDDVKTGEDKYPNCPSPCVVDVREAELM